MAEYIDKQKYREEWLKFKTFEPMKCLDLIPIADVIERSKIDKAIEEIEGEYSTCNQDWIDGLNRALDILKRHIKE